MSPELAQMVAFFQPPRRPTRGSTRTPAAGVEWGATVRDDEAGAKNRATPDAFCSVELDGDWSNQQGSGPSRRHLQRHGSELALHTTAFAYYAPGGCRLCAVHEQRNQRRIFLSEQGVGRTCGPGICYKS